MEDDSLPYAAHLLRRTDRDHRSMLPRSHWRVRVLHLGLISDRFQAVQFDTSIGIVSVLWLWPSTARELKRAFFSQRSAMEEGLLFFRRGLSTAGFHRAPDCRSQNEFRSPHERPALRQHFPTMVR